MNQAKEFADKKATKQQMDEKIKKLLNQELTVGQLK